MRPPVLVHIAWTLVAVVAFVVGTFVTNAPPPYSPAVPADENTAVGAAPIAPRSAQEEFLPLIGNLSDGTILNSEQARARTFEVLSEPNRIRRMRQLSELLEHVTKENWKDIIDAFMKQTINAGRTHDQEWFLMLERVGEVAGSEAIETAASFAGGNRMPWLLIGWASSDTDKALEWFQSQPPEMQTRLFQPLVNGIAKSDPKRALGIAIQQQQELQEDVIGLIMDQAIQRGGFSAAEGLLKPLIGRTDIEDGTRGKLFYNIARRKMNSVRLDGDPLKVLDWFDGYLGDGSPAGGAATKDIINSTVAVNAEATLKWLEERSGRFGNFKASVAYPIVARALQTQAPEKLTAWMDTHPEHPQRDAMASAAATALLQMQKLDDAKRLGATIRDEKIRAQLEKAFLQQANRNQEPVR